MKTVDFVLQFMRANHIPLTRENYLAIDRPGVDPSEPLEGELEAELPEQLQFGFEGWVN